MNQSDNSGRAVREWWIDPSENDESEDCDIRQYDAFNKHPGQGDLLWQSNLIHVIEKSAYDALQAENDRLKDQLQWSLKNEEQYKEAFKAKHEELAEIGRLHRVVAKELSENDELGCEYTYVNALREELQYRDALLGRCEQALESLSQFDQAKKALAEIRKLKNP